jgi:hypothetical protein
VIVATEVESAYPHFKTGKFFAQDTGISLEQVTALSFVAAATSRIRLLTSVLVLPHRHPVLGRDTLRQSVEVSDYSAALTGADLAGTVDFPLFSSGARRISALV